MALIFKLRTFINNNKCLIATPLEELKKEERSHNIQIVAYRMAF